MNKFITAVTNFELNAVKEFVKDEKWRNWSEPTGKNALHYLCAVPSENDIYGNSVATLKFLLSKGMEIDSVHRIEDKKCDFFPATPLWYAYTRGRNEKLYKYLLKEGADTRHCWWAIAWNDDVAAGKLWMKHGATIDTLPTLDELFFGSVQWKKYKFAE